MLMQFFIIVFFSGVVDDAPCVPSSAHVYAHFIYATDGCVPFISSALLFFTK